MPYPSCVEVIEMWFGFVPCPSCVEVIIMEFGFVPLSLLCRVDCCFGFVPCVEVVVFERRVVYS